MASRGRKKRTADQQSNTLLTYLSPKVGNNETLCKKILDNIINTVLYLSDHICSEIIDDVLKTVTAPSDASSVSASVTKKLKRHDGCKVATKTLLEWKKKFPWVEINDSYTNMKCEICVRGREKLKLTSVWAHEGSPNIQISALTRHDQSFEHKKACAELEKESNQTVLEKPEESDDYQTSVSREDIVVFNTIYHAAKSEIPSNNINGLLLLQTKNGLDVKYTNLSWDSITEMQNSIAHVLREEMVAEIQTSGVFALMLDESTDVTVDKRLSICVRYVKSGEPFTKMLCNVPIDDGRAHTIVNCVAEECKKLGIDLRHCTSLATDGAAAMMGKHTGAGKQIISKYSPFCVQTHCMAHRLNLACTDAVKKDEYMMKFRDKFSSLFLFVNSSSSRTLTLKKIQRLLEEPELSVKEPYSVRWLGLRNAVLAVFESFGAILATLSKFAAEKNAAAKGLFKYFRTYKVALVIAMVLDVHNELAILSCELQKKNLLFSEVKPIMDGTIYKLTSLETSDGECLNDMKSLIKKSQDGAFFGEEKLIYHEEMDKEFETVRINYINRLKKNIGNRFRKEDSTIFDDFSKLFEPSLVNSSTNDECLKAIESLSSVYGNEKTVTFVHGNLIEGTEEEIRNVNPLLDSKKLKEEWPRLQGMIKGTYSKLSTNNLCKRIILLHREMMPNFVKLAKIALCMQVTSVECERSFSTQNRLKTKYRASMGNEKLNTLMTISMLGPDLSSYDPTASVNHWFRQRRRRKNRLFMQYKPRPEKQQKVC